MRIAILSRGRQLHSVKRLLQEAKKLRVRTDVIDPLECQLVLDQRQTRILHGSKPMPHYEGLIPRIGASITDYGLAVLRQFEMLGTNPVNRSDAIAESRDKMRSMQILTEAGLKVPATALTRSHQGLRMAIQAVKGMPVVLKTLRGTQGVGVMLVHTPLSLSSVRDTMQGLEQDVILQQFIAEGAGRDYRVLIVGGKIMAAMMRTASPGEFRSNIHRGGEGSQVELPKAYQRAALQAAKAFGLKVAGVDIIESHFGPMILEVNSSPGFEGIEKATGINIAGAIVKETLAVARTGTRPGAKRLV